MSRLRDPHKRPATVMELALVVAAASLMWSAVAAGDVGGPGYIGTAEAVAAGNRAAGR